MSTPKFAVSYTGPNPTLGTYPAGPVYTVIATDPGNQQALQVLNDLGPQLVAALADHHVDVAEASQMIATLARDLGQPTVAALTQTVLAMVPPKGGKVNVFQVLMAAGAIAAALSQTSSAQ